MESSLVLTSASSTSIRSPQLPKTIVNGWFLEKNRFFLKNGHFSTQKKLSICRVVNKRKSLVVVAAAKKEHKKKENSHSAVPNPDEIFFPEAVLLKEAKVQEDGRVLPDFADDDEKLRYESLTFQLESDYVERVRHYEVVYLIHEEHDEEVESVNQKIQDFLREKKGRVWRFNDWGMRELAYKILHARNAHYFLMNFELEAKWINDFKAMLDSDLRIIRHLVIKRDEAITEDCPPPPEFRTIRAGLAYDDEEDDEDYEDEDDEDYEDEEYEEGEDEEYEEEEEEEEVDDTAANVIYVDEELDDESEDRPGKEASVSGEKRRKPVKVGR